jgi:hypothetical protein
MGIVRMMFKVLLPAAKARKGDDEPPAVEPPPQPAVKHPGVEPPEQFGDERFVPTAKSRPKSRPTVAVFGAGIAGLTAAHELAERGFIVTVYEPEEDPRIEHEDDKDKDDKDKKVWGERRRLTGARKAAPVRLGGLAATQYLTGEDRLWWFSSEGAEATGPVVPTDPPLRNWPPTGEHGFRFFPAYYLHLWDMLQRIPVYTDPLLENATVTPRTVYDNVERVITQAVMSTDGKPSLVLPREAPRSIAEFLGAQDEIREMGFTVTDLSTFLGRIVRYLVTSPERRASELEEVSAYEFFVDVDPTTGRERYKYSAAFKRQILDMPKILAAFDSQWGDARTNISTYLQLNLALDRYDSKADGVLNGPTTEVWFDHWYRHLKNLGVKFEKAGLEKFTLGPKKDEDGNDVLGVALDNGRTLEYEYYVVATDGYRAELATRPLRPVPTPADPPGADPKDAGEDAPELPEPGDQKDPKAKPAAPDPRYLRSLSTVLGLDGWATGKPPDKAPHDPIRAEGGGTRDPYTVSELGIRPWDRYQTLSGIQFFFDTEFQIVRGHMYFASSEWGLSAINQSGFWTDAPNLETDGYASVMSVDIGEWNMPSSTAKAARDCTRDEIAREVWRQITAELGGSSGAGGSPTQVPVPIWYAIDEFIEFEEGPPLRNHAPYLIPIKRDWKNRPGAYPWNPHGTSYTYVPNEEMRKDQEKWKVWQAGHGGYQVHHDKLVFAGTWCRTFTRMTTMEAACESGRHAVNAILDHYLYKLSEAGGGEPDERDLPALSWRLPFGFVDQELSSPIRQPTPAGDYCFIFDCENREPADARPNRLLDEDYVRAGLPHPWQVWGIDNAAAVASSLGGGYGGDDPSDPTLWIIDQLRQWRRLVETIYGDSAHGDVLRAKAPDWGWGSMDDPDAGQASRPTTTTTSPATATVTSPATATVTSPATATDSPDRPVHGAPGLRVLPPRRRGGSFRPSEVDDLAHRARGILRNQLRGGR